MRVLYVRHGESVANKERTIGTPDTVLSEQGLDQARKTGQDLRSENVSTVVCSPFIRAQQTAEIIAGELGLPVHDIVVIDELHERRMGELEGKPKRHESAFFIYNDSEFGCETHQQVIARAHKALEKVKHVAEKADGTTVVVGHAAFGFFFKQIAKGKTGFEDFEPFNQMSNAEFVELTLK